MRPARQLIPAYAGLVIMLGAVAYWVTGLRGADIFSRFQDGTPFFFTVDFHSALGKFLLQLLVIVLASQLVGRLLRAFRQPPVIGEVLAGIFLGPSLFGLFFPEVFQFVFEAGSLQPLHIISQLGLLLFMFSVGLQARPEEWKRQGPAVLFISHASILIPFTLGIALAPYLYSFSSEGPDFTAFTLFCGISLSITAFPVLARILHDRGLTRLPTARMALSCAAIDDLTAWVVLAGIVGIAKGGSLNGIIWTLVSSVGGIFILLKIVSPALSRTYKEGEEARPSQFVAAICVLFASALYFELAGVHALFGAFLAGAVMPKSEQIRQLIVGRVEHLSGLILLPAFFAITGLRTQITLLDSWALWGGTGVVITVAIAGKLGGTALAARFCGLPWKDAAFLGVLMNTRGLMELVVLNIGLELGIISQALFTVLVLMALLTTLMTGPALSVMNRMWRKQR